MIKKILLLANFVVIGCSLLSFASPYISPKSLALSSVMGLSYPYLLIGNILFMILWLAIDKKHSLWSFAIFVLGLPIIFKYYGTKTDNTHIDLPRNALKVVSYNIQASKYSNFSDVGMTKSLEAKQVGFLKGIADVDIFCGQEVSFRSRLLIEKAFDFDHTHFYNDRQTAIFSKHPIVDKGQIDFGTRQNSCIWVDIKFNDEVVRIYNVHLESNKLTKKAEKVFQGDLQEKQTWKNIGAIFQRYSMNAENRVFQVRRIVSHKKRASNKAIICGDFNDVPQSFTYNFISQGMKDSFIEKGGGIGTTYAGPIPGLRIDYILTDPVYEIVDHDIIKEKYSDHYPIAAEILVGN